MTRLSGVQLKPSTASRGVASWIRSLRAGLALQSPSLENNLASKTNAGSGQRFGESFAKLMPDGSLEKTFQGSFLPTMEPPPEPCSGTWPRSGIALRGTFFPLPPWERRNSEEGCSSWPSVRVGCHGEPGADARHPTIVSEWITPMTPNGGRQGLRTEEGREGKTSGLEAQASMQWMSPAAGGGGSVSRGGDGIDEPLLAGQATFWATPDTNTSTRSNGQRGPNLREQCLTGLPAPPPATSGSESSPQDRTSPRPRLNAKFVTWLMGLPHGWTSLRPLEPTSCECWATQSYQYVARLLS